MAELRGTMGDVGLDPDSIVMSEIRDQHDAESRSFVGSPTIRIDGVDVDPPKEDEPFGLTCRIYRREDGRVSPMPDGEQVREALRAAIDRKER
ncbi:MAG: hypothetical protein ABR536_01730 [Solirubrobacterales bacterium]